MLFLTFFELVDKLLKNKHTGRYFKQYKNEDEFYQFDLPVEWNHIDSSDAYGEVFSDSQRLEGKITVKTMESLYQDFDGYVSDLAAALKKHNNYMLISKNKIKLAGCDAFELEFNADAEVGRTKVDAIIKNLVVNDTIRERFVSITFSVLKRDYEKYSVVYGRLKKTFDFF